MSNNTMINEMMHSDESFLWTVTGSVRDMKYQPLTWLIIIGLIVGFVPMARAGFFSSWCWCVVAAICLIPIIYYNRIYHSYTLTNKRLIIISGIFTKHVDEIELFRVVDSTVSQSMIDLWAGLGTVRVTSEDQTGTVRMKKIQQPNKIRESLREAYMKARNEKGTVLMESVNRMPMY